MCPACRYCKKLPQQLGLPQVASGVESVWHLFVVTTDRRDELLAHLEARGVQAGIHYPIPLHELKAQQET